MSEDARTGVNNGIKLHNTIHKYHYINTWLRKIQLLAALTVTEVAEVIKSFRNQNKLIADS